MNSPLIIHTSPWHDVAADLEWLLDQPERDARRAEAAERLSQAVVACDPDDRVMLLETILDEIRPGWPLSHERGLMVEAGWWADNATRNERKAYLLACWNRLADSDRQGFLAYVSIAETRAA